VGDFIENASLFLCAETAVLAGAPAGPWRAKSTRTQAPPARMAAPRGSGATSTSQAENSASQVYEWRNGRNRVQ